MMLDEKKIKESLLNTLKEFELESNVIDDAVFHLTDWLKDLEAWHSFCAAPESYSNDELRNLLINFLVHVPAHLAAASKLITGIPVKDDFGIGATSAKKE